MGTYEKYYVPEQSKFQIYAATSLFILVIHNRWKRKISKNQYLQELEIILLLA